MEEKNWLEPTEVIEYDENLGKQCMEDPENNWEDKIEDGIGDPVDAEEANG